MAATFPGIPGLERALCDKFARIATLPGSPQTFEIVEFARPRRKNVNDEVHIIEEYPLAFGVSFDMQRPNAFALQRFFDMFGNGLVMACRSSGADEEIIGEGADSAEFDHNGILRFFVERCFNRVG